VSADTPRNADAVPPPRAGHEQAAEPDRAQSAERAPGRPPADAGPPPHPAQALNRTDYNAARHEQPPIQRQADTRNPAPADAPPPAAGGNHDRRTERAAPGQPHETATTPAPRETQALNRADYNAARHAEPPVRDTHPGEGKPPASEHRPDDRPAITHYHADFKGHRTDLYTDGTRWASGDHAREQATAGRGELPDDSPTGQDLVDRADEEGSPAERLRRALYDEGEDISDVIEHGANRGYDLFAPPPTSSYEAHPVAGPYFSAQHHNGMDVGTGATALFALGLAVDRMATWTMRHFEKHPEGD
jgi:hypothetical protein